ncbi:MAG: rRNA maturation RNase YbeY [Gloeobacteraceae cyanobacterium ES-bin-316]|nr:rRNA maturation RNase YbeY [Ferruginibacter sp.]
MVISFNFLSSVSLTNRNALKDFIGQIFLKEKKRGGELSIVFCSDDYLLKINQTYLNHNFFTDIITFDLSVPGTTIIDGEIYISVDTIRDNASTFENTITRELHRVIFHGVLHLCGYKDKTPKDKSLMTTKEDFYLRLYFPSN